MTDLILYFSFISLVFTLVLTFYYFIKLFKHKIWIKKVFYSKDENILKDNESKVDFDMKLTQAGLSKSEFNQIVFLSIFAGISLAGLPFFLNLNLFFEVMIFLIAFFIALVMPFLYLDEQKKARIKRIERDLAIFIDLLIIILEGGGGLHNAIDQVTQEASDVIGKDLLDESRKFKYEFITYGSDIAYNNLILRTDSEAIATIVGFMKLSQETGIGVKTIFENQSNEIKESDMLNLEKKASLINIAITFTMFIFILPAIIAMITFPIAAGALMNFNF